VMLIGDDDAVLPAQWPRLRALLAGRRPAALAWPPLFYQWPAAHKRGGGGLLRLRRGLVHGVPERRTAARHRQAIVELERTREDFAPKLYHGLVARPVLEGLRARTGEAVMSGQVDAYFSAALPAMLDDYLYIRHPFTILAMGPQSGGSSVLEQFAGTANRALDAVAREAAADPVREALAGPFPCLGFYLLAGIEQARRHVYAGDPCLGGDRPLQYGRYYAMILDQLAHVPGAARARGIAILETLAAETGSADALAAAIAACPTRPAHPAVAKRSVGGPFAALIRRFESLSHVAPGRVVLDLKRRRDAPARPGAVDHAAALADRLLGPAADAQEGAEEGAADPARAWRGVHARALAVILRG
ncbi:MAG: hypothetical protein LDL22_04220, partial [Hyphomicrobiales bacterium]|nr:hypothetical protein [Hyphomicrobiales bacterium]